MRFIKISGTDIKREKEETNIKDWFFVMALGIFFYKNLFFEIW